MKKRAGLFVAIASVLLLAFSVAQAYQFEWFSEPDYWIYNRDGNLVPMSSPDYFLVVYKSTSATIPAFDPDNETTILMKPWTEYDAEDGAFYGGFLSTETTPPLVSGEWIYTRLFEGPLASPIAFTTLTFEDSGLATQQFDPTPAWFQYIVGGATASSWTVIPEPTTVALLVLGVGAMGLRAIRRRR